MFSRTVTLVAGLIVATASATSWAKAAQPQIPKSFYPSGAHITRFPVFSNDQMDCNWGFFCEGNVPLFHFQSQDELRRLGGWAEYASWTQNHHRIETAIYASAYSSEPSEHAIPRSQEAFIDFQHATYLHGYRVLPLRLAHPIRSAPGNTVIERQPGPTGLLVEACWSGTFEVEALIADGGHTLRARRLAISTVSALVHAAMQTARSEVPTTA